jgi:ribosome biogenesis GTPase / thiamine phosphate phosphatase
MTLAALGWNEQRQQAFAPHAGQGLLAGRIIGEHRTHFQVATNTIELSAGTTGRLRNAAAQRSDLPGVGDFVAVRPSAGDGPASIEAVLPRTTAIIRQAAGEKRPQLLAANVDVVFVVTALDGDFNAPRLQRYLALVRDSGAIPVIVVNKIDLSQSVGAIRAELAGFAPGIPAHAISARAGDSTRDLLPYFSNNQTITLIGSSGVGKSTLTNQLLGRAAQATQEVRAHDNRGRHTTTHRELFLRPGGGSIIDTPGMRGLELWNAERTSEIDFTDIEALAAQCKFRDCQHSREPACAVRAAVDRGDIDAAHLANYTKHTRPQQRVGR